MVEAEIHSTCYIITNSFPSPVRLMDDVIPFDNAASSAVHAGVEALRDVGALFWQQGWSRGTSSNYSIVLNRDPFRLLLTASGKDKRRLKATDFVVVDETGRPTAATDERPSAETGLHVVLARQVGVGSVLHTHSVWGTLLSELYASARRGRNRSKSIFSAT